MSHRRVTLLIVLAGVVAIAAVVVSSGEVDLPGGGGGDEQRQPARADAEQQQPGRPEAEQRPPARAGTEQPPAQEDDLGRSEPDVEELPEDPDDVRGSDSFALTRPANLRRALAVLERERRPVDGVYDGLRIAPGRIDTVIVHPDDRRTNIQLRADLEVAFETTHDFPTRADFRQHGITARDVDVSAPARLLRAIDRVRPGSAAHDVDYLVIDRATNLSAYMRLRSARPRMFSSEPDGGVRAIG